MRCPTCRKDVDPASKRRPFCSERCKLIDLGRWLDGAYVVPGEAVSEDDIADIAEDIDDDVATEDEERPRRH
jgi:uncharacterized protein